MTKMQKTTVVCSFINDILVLHPQRLRDHCGRGQKYYKNQSGRITVKQHSVDMKELLCS